MPDHGADLVTHFLLNELRAEGHITQVERDWWVYAGPTKDYRIKITATPIKKPVRLSED